VAHIGMRGNKGIERNDDGKRNMNPTIDILRLAQNRNTENGHKTRVCMNKFKEK
jgi:hypothetical protein